jgi:co-chaperonin GroES (HSP10)
MYYLSPQNNYLLIEPLEVTEEKPQQAFLLPTDYKEKQKPYKVMRVIEDANDKYRPESLILVPSHLIEEVEIESEKHYLIPQNYVIATVTEE